MGRPGHFPSRWLTALGPWLNGPAVLLNIPGTVSSSGTCGPSALGRPLCDAGLHLQRQRLFDSQILGSLAWVILGSIVATILGWKLVRYLRGTDSVNRSNSASA